MNKRQPITPKFLFLGITLFVMSLLGHVNAQEYAYAHNTDSGELTELVVLLNELSSVYNVHFLFQKKLLENKFANNEVLKTGNLIVSLNQILQPNGLSYEKVDDRTISVVKKKDTDDQDTFTVSGNVTSSDEKEPLIGVTVIVKGTTNGAITDISGNYAIGGVKVGDTLAFTYVGYDNQEIIIQSQTVINVSMNPGLQRLDDVVVTAVGIREDKRILAYSIQDVDADAVQDSKETNLINALTAKAAGVQINASSGSPGSSARIRIRGNRSLTLSNEPLFVVDGIPVNNFTSATSGGVDRSNRLVDINPNDVADLTVLKGPAATALYGIRAANGAILITTKSGSKGKPKVVISSSYMIDEVNKLPKMQHSYAQGYNGIHYDALSGSSNSSYSWGPHLSELEFDGIPNDYSQYGRLVPVGTGSGMEAIGYDPNDAFWVKGHTLDNYVSVSGGSETNKYYISAGRLYQTGIIPRADFERKSIKTSFEFKASDKMTIGASANFVNSGGYRVQRGSNSAAVTVGVWRNPTTFDIGNGKEGWKAAKDKSSYMLPDGLPRAFSGIDEGRATYDNPFWTINQNPYVDEVNRYIGNVYMNYDLLPWLKATYKLGTDHYSDDTKWSRDRGTAGSLSETVDMQVSTFTSYNSDFILLINEQIAPKLSMHATLGHNYYTSKRQTREVAGRNFLIPGFFDISNTSLYEDVNENQNNYALIGVYGDFKFSYNDLVYLNLSGRNDWSSTLPAKNNSFFYPTISAGFNFTKALGMENNDIMPFGKLRVSYGLVGNDPGLYDTRSYYGSANVDGDGLLSAVDFPAYNTNAIERSGNVGNEKLKAELTSTMEIGTDLKFLKERVSLDFTYYYSNTTDAIVDAQLSSTSGYTTITINAGEVENKGVEVLLSGTPVLTNNFTWDIDANFSLNRSKVNSIMDDTEQLTVGVGGFSRLDVVTRVGQPFGMLAGTQYERNDAGQLIIGPDGYPLVSANNEILANPNPDWTAGIRNSFSYKDFVSLSFLWDIRMGGDIWNGTRGVMNYFGTSKQSALDREIDDYVFEGVVQVKDADGNVIEEVPNETPVSLGQSWYRLGGLYGVAEDQIEDGSWYRLREVTLTFNLPRKWTSSVNFVEGASLSLHGRNLLLFTDYSGVDPDTNFDGGSSTSAVGKDYFNLPGTRSYGVSLKITL